MARKICIPKDRWVTNWGGKDHLDVLSQLWFSYTFGVSLTRDFGLSVRRFSLALAHPQVCDWFNHSTHTARLAALPNALYSVGQDSVCVSAPFERMPQRTFRSYRVMVNVGVKPLGESRLLDGHT